MTARRIVLTLAVNLSALIADAQGQTPRLSTNNITAEADKVYVAARGAALENL